MTKILQTVPSTPWIHLGLVAFTLSLMLSACSKEPEAGGPEVSVGADGLEITLSPEDLVRLVSSLKNISELAGQIQQLVPPTNLAESPISLPDPPAGLPGLPSGPPSPSGFPGKSPGASSGNPSLPGALPRPEVPSLGKPEIPEEIRNRMGLEVEALLGFLDDPNTSIPGKDHLHRIIDLTTSGTGQFSAQELEELEGEVQGILGEIQQASGPAGLVVGGPGPGGPGGPGPGGPGPGRR